MKNIIQRIEPHKPILLFLDYDGTLVPIRRTPEEAVLSPLRREILKALSKKVFICITSGRSLREIKKLVKIVDIAYIGNHGLEIDFQSKHWVHPEALKKKAILKDVLRKISQRIKNFPGVLIEDKELTGSIHYRLLAPGLWTSLKNIVYEEYDKKKNFLKMTEGKRVLEVRPRVEWDKGKGVKKILSWLDFKERPIMIYLGDDQTDEDSFRVFQKGDLTIRVGLKMDTYASYRLKDVGEVWKFLKSILQIVTRD